MKYLLFILSVVVFTACGSDNATENSTQNTDSLDSVHRAEEEEMSKEIVEGAFDALNR